MAQREVMVQMQGAPNKNDEENCRVLHSTFGEPG